MTCFIHTNGVDITKLQPTLLPFMCSLAPTTNTLMALITGHSVAISDAVSRLTAWRTTPGLITKSAVAYALCRILLIAMPTIAGAVRGLVLVAISSIAARRGELELKVAVHISGIALMHALLANAVAFVTAVVYRRQIVIVARITVRRSCRAGPILASVALRILIAIELAPACTIIKNTRRSKIVISLTAPTRSAIYSSAFCGWAVTISIVAVAI